MAVKDTIEREIILPASRERVWAAITDSRKLEQWFGTKAEFKRLAVGEPINFSWDDAINRGRIESVEPMHHFAYRWMGSTVDPDTPFDESLSTLVTFQLDDVPEGTRLHLVESGFAALPEHLRGKQWQMNDSGWMSELKDLENYLKTLKEA